MCVCVCGWVEGGRGGGVKKVCTALQTMYVAYADLIKLILQFSFFCVFSGFQRQPFRFLYIDKTTESVTDLFKF